MSHNTSYCLIEVITKADLPNSEWFASTAQVSWITRCSHRLTFYYIRSLYNFLFLLPFSNKILII